MFEFFCGMLQNGTTEEVKKIVTILNEAEVPSEDVVGKFSWALYFLNFGSEISMEIIKCQVLYAFASITFSISTSKNNQTGPLSLMLTFNYGRNLVLSHILLNENLFVEQNCNLEARFGFRSIRNFDHSLEASLHRKNRNICTLLYATMSSFLSYLVVCHF